MKKLYRFIVVLATLIVFSSCQWFADRFMENDNVLVESFQIYNDLDYAVSMLTNINEGGVIESLNRSVSIEERDTITFVMSFKMMRNHPDEGSLINYHEIPTPPIIHIYDADDSVVYSAILFSYRKETPAFFDSAFWECVSHPYSEWGSLINSVYLLKLSSIIDTSSHI